MRKPWLSTPPTGDKQYIKLQLAAKHDPFSTAATNEYGPAVLSFILLLLAESGPEIEFFQNFGSYAQPDRYEQFALFEFAKEQVQKMPKRQSGKCVIFPRTASKVFQRAEATQQKNAENHRLAITSMKINMAKALGGSCQRCKEGP